MTIRSMPSNAAFRENYSRNFKEKEIFYCQDCSSKMWQTAPGVWRCPYGCRPACMEDTCAVCAPEEHQKARIEDLGAFLGEGKTLEAMVRRLQETVSPEPDLDP